MDATPDLPAIRPNELTRARIAVSSAFFVGGLGTGIWAVHIPVVQARLALDAATLGLVLFAIAGGAVVAMPAVGWAIGRYGSRIPTAALMIAYAILIAPPTLAGSLPVLFVAAALFGAALGGLDVAANMQASEVERARGRPTMSSFHGFYSVGGLAGSAIGAGIIAAGWGDGSGASIAAVVFLAVVVVAARDLYPGTPPLFAATRFALPNRAVLALGLIAILCFAAEGAVGDWSALYLATVKTAGDSGAALGFALYSLAMAFCRLTGDRLVARLGARLTVVLGGGVIALGMATAILSPWAILSATGFGIIGVGAANIVPTAFGAASRTSGVTASYGIAAISTLGYAGFLLAPPIIGGIANAAGLSLGLWVVAASGVIIAAVAAAGRWKN